MIRLLTGSKAGLPELLSGPYPVVGANGIEGFWPKWTETTGGEAFAEFDLGHWPTVAEIYFSLHDRCMSLKKMLGIAESCTGGSISAQITDFAGSSRYLYGGWVVYSNHAKHHFLGVNPYDIEEQGAVSEVVVNTLLNGIFENSPCKLAMAVSGIAGPEGGSPQKPIGTVWCGVAEREGRRIVRQFRFSGDRQAIRRVACEVMALMLLELTHGL